MKLDCNIFMAVYYISLQNAKTIDKNLAKLDKYSRTHVIQRQKSLYHKAVDVSVQGLNMPLWVIWAMGHYRHWQLRSDNLDTLLDCIDAFASDICHVSMFLL